MHDTCTAKVQGCTYITLQLILLVIDPVAQSLSLSTAVVISFDCFCHCVLQPPIIRCLYTVPTIKLVGIIYKVGTPRSFGKDLFLIKTLKNPKNIILLFLMRVSRHRNTFNGLYQRSVGLTYLKLTLQTRVLHVHTPILSIVSCGAVLIGRNCGWTASQCCLRFASGGNSSLAATLVYLAFIYYFYVRSEQEISFLIKA